MLPPRMFLAEHIYTKGYQKLRRSSASLSTLKQGLVDKIRDRNLRQARVVKGLEHCRAFGTKHILYLVPFSVERGSVWGLGL